MTLLSIYVTLVVVFVHSLQGPWEVGDHCYLQSSVRWNDLLRVIQREASVCCLAWDTHTDITSNSSAGAGEYRLKPKVKIPPPSQSQYITQSNPFPKTRPGKKSTGSVRGVGVAVILPIPTVPRTLIPIRIGGKACVTSSLCSFLLTVVPDLHA